MTEPERLIAAAYEAFNGRDLEAAVGLMHPDVDWPNAWEGGRVRGHAAVREYWERQFAEIDPQVEPESIEAGDDEVTVRVHQVVRDRESGQVVSDNRVTHRYALRGGLIERMDVVDDV